VLENSLGEYWKERSGETMMDLERERGGKDKYKSGGYALRL